MGYYPCLTSAWQTGTRGTNSRSLTRLADGYSLAIKRIHAIFRRMDSTAFARNLYLSHRIEPVTQARLDEWDASMREAQRLPATRWQRRRDAFLRAASTSASTRIEGNQLSLWETDQLQAGMRIEGRERDQREVRNYSTALGLAAELGGRESFEWHEMVLQQLNAAVMRGLENDTRGAYRTGPVTVGAGFYAAPNAASVPALMATLVDWLEATELHPLVRVSLLHLNLAAIHPWFDGNGRTMRIVCQLDLGRVVRAPHLVNIEPVLAADQDGYFRRIRDAVGMSWDPENHVASAWVDWYVGLHLDALREGLALDEATRQDMTVILAALERRGEDADWGPVILTAAYGEFTTRLIQGMYGNSSSATRVMVGRLVDAGWLLSTGETRGRTYHPSDLVASLGLASPGLARRLARAEPSEQPNQEF